VSDGDFIIDRLVACDFLIFKDDFPSNARHRLAMFGVIGALRIGRTDTCTAETGVGGWTEQEENTDG
jgi:hypothetical protein